MAKQPVKKKTLNFDWLNSMKSELKGNVANKPVEFIEMPSGYQKALHLSGIPMGQLTLIAGHSNTGKSSMANGVIVGAQKKGILPVIIDTENNFSFQYAKAFGMDAEPVYGKVKKEVINTETGEVTEIEEDGIVDWEGFFFYFNQASLLKKYGKNDYATNKTTSKVRTVPCIEDVATCIKEFLDAQDEGKIDCDLCFIWDSVGSVHSFDSLNATSQQNMRDAQRLKESFSTIIPRITATRNQSCKHQNTMFAVNKVWTDNISAMGKPLLKLSCGEGLYFHARLVIQLGGNANASITFLNATSKGEKYTYGIETKIKVIKNHLDAPYNITYDGKMACVSNSIIGLDEEDQWKKDNAQELLKSLQAMLENDGKSEVLTEADIEFDSQAESDLD